MDQGKRNEWDESRRESKRIKMRSERVNLGNEADQNFNQLRITIKPEPQWETAVSVNASEQKTSSAIIGIDGHHVFGKPHDENSNLDDIHDCVVIRINEEGNNTIAQFYNDAGHELHHQDFNRGQGQEQASSKGVVTNETVSVITESVGMSPDEVTQKKCCWDECVTVHLNQANQIQHLEDQIRSLEDTVKKKDDQFHDLNNRTVRLEEFTTCQRQTMDVGVECDLMPNPADQIQETGQRSVVDIESEILDNVVADEQQQGSSTQKQITVADGILPDSDSDGTRAAISAYKQQILQHLQPYLSEKDVLGTGSLLFDPTQSSPSSEMSQEDLGLLMNNAELLLDIHGTEITHLAICSYAGLESVVEFYQRLVIWLTMVPNLRSLHVVPTHAKYYWEKYTVYGVRSLALPALAALQTLHLEWIMNPEDLSAQGVASALMRSYMNDQLQRLCLPANCGIRWNWKRWDKVSLKGLSELKIAGDWSEGNCLDILLRCGARLEKLEIGTGDLHRASHVTLFNQLDGFPIRVLDISPEFLCRPREGPAAKVFPRIPDWNLPLLKTLRVQHFPGQRVYKYLEQMPALQNLELVIFLDESKSWTMERRMFAERVELFKKVVKEGCILDWISKEVISWVGQEPTRDRTRIWGMLPNLQCIAICFKILLKKESPNLEGENSGAVLEPECELFLDPENEVYNEGLVRSVVHIYRKNKYVQ